jgi:hypothetical protein
MGLFDRDRTRRKKADFSNVQERFVGDGAKPKRRRREIHRPERRFAVGDLRAVLRNRNELGSTRPTRPIKV